jgi:hypothetical protein
MRTVTLEPLLQEERPAPSRAEIEALAHALWASKGFPDGTAEEDWLQAERQLTLATLSNRVPREALPTSSLE